MIDDKTKEMVTAVANATTGVSDLAGKGMDMVDKLGGDLLKELIGIPTDQIKALRFKLGVKLVEDAKEFNRLHGIENNTPIPAKLAIPMLENGSLEEDETLRQLWVRLMANAMNPAYAEKIHPAYIEMIRQVSPDEALILQHSRYLPDFPLVFFIKLSEDEAEETRAEYATFCKTLPLKHPDDRMQYLDNLLRLQLLAYGHQMGTIRTGYINVTVLGMAFIEACTSPSDKLPHHH